jgi:hypothetical protein
VISLVGVVEELVIPLGTVSSLPPLFATLWSPGQTPATRVTGTRWEWIQLKLDPSLKRLSSLLELAKKNRVPRTTAMDETFSTADSKTGPWRISMSEFPLWAEQWENFTPELMNSFHELTQSYPQIRKLKIQVSD